MTSSLPPLANRTQSIQPFWVMDLLAQAKALEQQGRSVIHLEIGEPDFPTPSVIRDAGAAALAQGLTQYTPALGLLALRTAIADFYQSAYGTTVDPARIIITPGASGALLLALSLWIEPGRSVLMADPTYPCNRNMVKLLGGDVLAVPVGAPDNFQVTPAHVEKYWQSHTRVALVATPSNPTGSVMTSAQLAALSQGVRTRGGVLIVDEIYQGLVYEQPMQTVLAVDDQAVVVNSFSKFFGMTGWRLGWLIVPPDYVEAVDRLAQNLFLAAPTLAQHAALAAFTPACLAECFRRREILRERRDYLLGAIRAMGFKADYQPEGAFYIYADCSAFTTDSMRFAKDLLLQEGVAITPGIDFGEHRALSHLRFAYAAPMEKLQEAVTRLQRFVHR